MSTPASHPQTVVLVHGYMDDGEIWADVRTGLEERSIPALALSLAGMGDRTTDAGPYTLNRWADDLTAQLNTVDGEVVLVGHSMGSQIAELAAARLGDRVRALVLINPIPLAGTQLPAEQIAPFQQPDLSLEGQKGFRRSLSTSFPDAELDRLSAVALNVAPTTIAATATAWNEGHPDGSGPSGYRGPVTILRGANDPFVTTEIVSSYVAPRFEDATEASIPDAGHWPHVENPAVVAAKIADTVNAESTNERPAQAWQSAFEQKSEEGFAAALALDVRLEASALAKPVQGKDKIKAVMAAVSGVYESLEFVHQVQDGERTYLEWRAAAFGGFAMKGITILKRDEAGLIAEIAIHHRPLGAVMQIASKVGPTLAGVLTPDYFTYTEGK
ncbi:alpha/beta fold hydrolase [Arthrobacter sp. NtRootA1]|uniref:alpha/beta fold hydrolase n=1 Tax=Arthrobacter sp. NtRootA1 TaxID=2830983 RepID=UPI001CC4C6DC|nr:alpha/beta fold hydrolase [Arthrobacter sp. NtRootA1]BCW05697.1 hypothetical protein NtRootA1_18350 [Arthrobacter sp. NtRootA1]